MAGVLVNGGEQIVLEATVAKTTGLALTLKLFQNNVTPAETDVAASYAEATFTGYAAAALTPASWVYTAGAPGVLAYPEQTFTSSANQASQTIYGYFLIQTATGLLVGAERFTGAGTPFAVALLNDAIKVTPTLTAD